MERLLKETIRLGLQTGVVHRQDMATVTVDTTVQEKAVRFPTDTQLCHTARAELVKLAAATAVPLRQSYARKSKHALFMANRYGAASQFKRAGQKMKEVRNYLGRVLREIERAVAARPELTERFSEALKKAKKIYAQANNRHEPDKVYAWHAPEVECIAKGKAHKKYEFGCKASLAVTNKSSFIVAAMAHHARPYDGHTLKTVLEQVKELTGIAPKEVHADQGYRGHGISETEATVILSRQKRGVTAAIKKRQRRRNAIEPIIGHGKNDRKVGPRNWLKGKLGDKINALAMAIGFNLRKILSWILLCLYASAVLCSSDRYIRPVAKVWTRIGVPKGGLM